MFLSRRKMYHKEMKNNNGLEMTGLLGQTSPLPVDQVFDGEILTDGKFCT